MSVSDHVNHLRSIHNKQTILSLVILYLAWSSGTGLFRDLNSFFRTAEEAKTLPERVADLMHKVLPNSYLLGFDLGTITDHPVETVPTFRIQSATSLSDELSPIGTKWQAIQNHELIFQTLGNPEDDLSEVRTWLDERRPSLERIEIHHRDSGRSAQDIHRLTTPIVRPSVTDWPPAASSAFAVVEIEVYVPRQRNLSELLENVTIIEKYPNPHRDHELGINFDRATFGPYRFVTETYTVPLPLSAFNPLSAFKKYPDLQKKLDEDKEFASLTSNDALAKLEQAPWTRGHDLKLFGTAIRGQHIGLVGIGAISILQIYLLLMLQDLRISIRKVSFDPMLLPWLATSRKIAAKLYSLLTLVFLPASAAGLAMWRLTTVNRLGVLAVTLILFVLGLWIMWVPKRWSLVCHHHREGRENAKRVRKLNAG